MGLWRYFHRDPARENRSGIVHVSGSFVTSTAGALVAASSDSPGFTLTKVGAKTGRYTVQFVDSLGAPAQVLQLAGFSCSIFSAVADTAYTTTKAVGAVIRNGIAQMAVDGTCVVQFIDKAAADGEVEDAAGFFLNFDVKLSTSVP